MRNLVNKILFLLPKGDKFKIALLFFLMFIAALLEVAGIGMIPAFVSIVASPDRVLEMEMLQPLFGFLGIDDANSLLIYGSIALVGIFILKGSYITAYNYVEAKFLFNRRYSIGERLMTAYMQAPYTFHLNKNSAELLRNITGEVSLIVNVVMDFLKISKESLMTVAILTLLFVTEPLITIIVIVLSGIGGGGFILLTQKKIKRLGLEDQQHRRHMIKAINQGLGGIKDARLLNREEELIKQFSGSARKSADINAYKKFINQIPKPVVETTAVLGMMLIAALMVFQGRPMESIIPILTLFAMATVRLMPAVQQISSIYTKLIYNKVAVDPVYEDMKLLEIDTKALRDDRKSSLTMPVHKKIVSEEVSYTYPGTEEPALHDVSFEVPVGSAIAFVGASGAGKTTMVDLLLGLIKPTNGKISVDGKNIHDSLSAWQKNVGYIPQSIYLADDTLRKNIAFALPESQIDDEKVIAAIEMAQLSEMVKKLPEGLDTWIGEHGTRISGGQRQRVGIARALYHNPKVLVMDEATSALDNVTEKQITEAIESLRGERTIIMIAHRLSTVQNCDRLYLMQDGKIVDYGSYDELAERNSEFQKMALLTES